MGTGSVGLARAGTVHDPDDLEEVVDQWPLVPAIHVSYVNFKGLMQCFLFHDL
jgi:hypothetical protein